MQGAVTVGFTPVVGTGAITHGSSGQAAPAAESPLGLFDALLQMASAELPEDVQIAPPAAPEQPPTGFFAAPEPLIAPIGVKEPTEADDETVSALVLDLVETLSAIEQTRASGTPIDPALEQQANDILDAAAELLGIPVTQPAGVDAVPAVPGTTSPTAPTAPLDPLATIQAAEASVAAPPAPPTTTAVPGAPPALPSEASSELTATGRTVPATDGEPPAADDANPELPPLAQKLVDKITRLAEALKPQAPGLAEKLVALADKLGSGEIDEAMLAKLGLTPDPEQPGTEIENAIARLLAPGGDAKPAPAPAPFAVARLALPEAIVLPPKARPTPSVEAKPATNAATPGTDAAPSESRLEPQPELEPQLKPEGRTSEPADKSQAQQAARPGPAVPAQANPTDPSPTQAAAPATAATTTIAADAKAVHAAYSAPVRQINIPQVAFEIVRHVQAGASRFQIRLDPPELGRVDVKLDVDAAGNVNARMTVERAETLDLMQRDQRALERALAQAGLDSSKTNLEFSLRQNPFAHQEQQQGHGRSPYAAYRATPESDDAMPPPQIIAYRGAATPGGINLFV